MWKIEKTPTGTVITGPPLRRELSKSYKSISLLSSGGNIDMIVDGQAVEMGVNVYIPAGVSDILTHGTPDNILAAALKDRTEAAKRENGKIYAPLHEAARQIREAQERTAPAAARITAENPVTAGLPPVVDLTGVKAAAKVTLPPGMTTEQAMALLAGATAKGVA